MKGVLNNYWQFPGTLFSLLKNLAVQKKFLQKNIYPLLQNARKDNDQSLDENDFRKITRYYGLAVPAILGEAFCALREYKMTTMERWASTCQGAMTGLFDDFYDKDYMDDESIKNKISFQAAPVTNGSNEKLFDTFYSMALSNVPVKKITQQTLIDVYNAQVESKNQTDAALTLEAIKEITFKKGGTSLVFYRSAFSPDATVNEAKFLYNIGGLMQLANDIFDVYKDREGGIRTLITEAKSISQIRSLFSTILDENYTEAYTLDYKPRNVKKFLSILSIGIFSRCYVCLDHLEKNELNSENKFIVQQYSRQQLICDMDTKKNMLRSAAYHLKTIK